MNREMKNILDMLKPHITKGTYKIIEEAFKKSIKYDKLLRELKSYRKIRSK